MANSNRMTNDRMKRMRLKNKARRQSEILDLISENPDWARFQFTFDERFFSEPINIDGRLNHLYEVSNAA